MAEAGERRGAERGSGTVLGLALVVVLLAAVLAVALLGSVMTARGRAQAGADLAALAAATALDRHGPGAACESAAQTARANGVTLAACSVEDADVVVAATVEADLGALGRRAARAEARAGPT